MFCLHSKLFDTNLLDSFRSTVTFMGVFKHKKKNLKAYNWVILCLMPFCVNFELITPFFLTCISILWTYDFIKTKKPNYTFLFAIALYCLLSLITIYRFLYLTFFSDFVPHRQDWSLYEMNSHLIHGFSAQSLLELQNTYYVTARAVHQP